MAWFIHLVKQSFGPHVFKSCSRDQGGVVCGCRWRCLEEAIPIHTMNGAMNGVISPGSYEKSTSSRGIFVISYALSLTKYFTRWWNFKYLFSFHPENWGRWTQFDEHIFQMGWNHQLEILQWESNFEIYGLKILVEFPNTSLLWRLLFGHPRWWFQIFVIFTPIPGDDDPIRQAYFSTGLVQPPTRLL